MIWHADSLAVSPSFAERLVKQWSAFVDAHGRVESDSSISQDSDSAAPGLGGTTWYPPHCQDPSLPTKPHSWLEYSKGELGNVIEGDVSNDMIKVKN